MWRIHEIYLERSRGESLEKDLMKDARKRIRVLKKLDRSSVLNVLRVRCTFGGAAAATVFCWNLTKRKRDDQVCTQTLYVYCYFEQCATINSRGRDTSRTRFGHGSVWTPREHLARMRPYAIRFPAPLSRNNLLFGYTWLLIDDTATLDTAQYFVITICLFHSIYTYIRAFLYLLSWMLHPQDCPCPFSMAFRNVYTYRRWSFLILFLLNFSVLQMMGYTYTREGTAVYTRIRFSGNAEFVTAKFRDIGLISARLNCLYGVTMTTNSSIRNETRNRNASRQIHRQFD